MAKNIEYTKLSITEALKVSVLHIFSCEGYVSEAAKKLSKGRIYTVADLIIMSQTDLSREIKLTQGEINWVKAVLHFKFGFTLSPVTYDGMTINNPNPLPRKMREAYRGIIRLRRTERELFSWRTMHWIEKKIYKKAIYTPRHARRRLELLKQA